MKSGMRVRLHLSGLSAEKVLNEAGRKGIRLEKIRRRINREITLECSPEDYPMLAALAEEKGFRVSGKKPVGIFRQLLRLKKRPGLILGAMAAALVMVWCLGYVWQVRVENAGAYEGEVKTCLEAWGIQPMIRKSQVSLPELREKLEWRFPQVKWIRTEWDGTALKVVLEEGTPPPDIETKGGPCDVVAAEDGLLVQLTTYAGTPVAKAGDFVRAGQALILGEERGENGALIPVKARGEAKARVWVTAEVRLPIMETVSLTTGRSLQRRLLEAPFFSWCGQEEADYLTCDVDRETVKIGGAWLPVWMVRETTAEVRLETRRRELEEVKEEGKKAAYLALKQALIADEIVDKWINCGMIEGDTICVSATGEALRGIGRSQSR